MVQLSPLFSLFLFGLSTVCATPPPSVTERDAPPPQSTACGEVVNSGDEVFLASLVYECLTSVPFNAAVGTRFIAYYNDTLKFQSTLAYLKNPPASYQQPATDLLAGLEDIQAKIDSGGYANQYQFEVALQSLLYSAHDAHVDLFAGVLAAFSFGTSYSIVSLSPDGVQLPKVYFTDDIGAGYTPSALKTINGQDVIEYLKAFGFQNSQGSLEANSEFNQLMSAPAQDIQAFFNAWGGGATFYPGDKLTFVLENGTTINTNWLAVYNSPGNTGPLETGGDFYNFFVLGFYPASYDPYATSPGSSATTASAASSTVVAAAATSTAVSTPGWGPDSGYPAVPDVAQQDLGTFGGGWVSGYFLKEQKIAVLSIPSFEESGSSVNTFSYAVQQFLLQSKAAGMTKVVVDLQQNWGGDALLAFDTFKQFFPTINPYAGSRLRAHNAVNVMGEAITGYWDSLTPDDDDYYNLASDEFVSSIRINADTGANFSSWSEFYGPHPFNEDEFTTVQQYNLSSYIFDAESVDDFDEYFAVYGFAGNPANTSQPYAAKDIIMLSDSLCSSACSLFMEMMNHEAGVRTVVAGGLPYNGPMQAPALSRGAAEYDVVDVLDGNIGYAQYILQAENEPYDFLPNRTEALGVYVTFASINLRDQIRRDSDIPLQFVYQAADCRIWFTPDTYYNYTALWLYAADAMWTNTSLCVKGSTGYSSTNTTDTTGPPSSVLPSQPSVTPPSAKYGEIIYSMFQASTESLLGSEISDGGQFRDDTFYEGTECPCPTDYFCMQEYKTCVDGKDHFAPACVPRCYVYPGICANSGTCIPLEETKGEDQQQLKVAKGYCDPLPLFCQAPKGVAKVKPGKAAPISKGKHM